MGTPKKRCSTCGHHGKKTPEDQEWGGKMYKWCPFEKVKMHCNAGSKCIDWGPKNEKMGR